jgi:hypothetical protein
MLTLEEMLKEREARLGKDHPAVQMLRNQIEAEKSGKGFQELYLTGAVSKQGVHRKDDGQEPKQTNADPTKSG